MQSATQHTMRVIPTTTTTCSASIGALALTKSRENNKSSA